MSSDYESLSDMAFYIWRELIPRKIGMSTAAAAARSCISHSKPCVRRHAFKMFASLFEFDPTLEIIPKEAADASLNDSDWW